MSGVERNLRSIELEYSNFLDDEEDSGKYSHAVKELLVEGGNRLLVNISDLKRKSPSRAKAILSKGEDELRAFDTAFREHVSSTRPDLSNMLHQYFIGLDGCFGDRHLTPRTLSTKFIGNVVCVEGIVTKVSLVKPKILLSVHFCPVTKKTIEMRHADASVPEKQASRSIYPTKDDEGNILETEFGLSIYRDHQIITLQEMPENSPVGQLPRSVDIICEADLVDKCKPGDRLKVVAVYKCIPSKNNTYTSGTFQTLLAANNILQLDKEVDISMSREEVNSCKMLAKTTNVFELLARSLAPSIYGQIFVKKAILCLLLGGIEKKLANGTRLRGDVNILLIGDPSVAKSQLLRYVLHVAPRAVTTTGRGSSGVGLTAAVTTDQETGERKLEAGAMVLADRGVVCIDEFDKMSDIDRTAIHEVMEQGHVTISKAGIHASLNARCSVLAAANPVYGKYDQYKTPMENIGLQDSLLTRFDLLFIMLDNVDKEQDKIIADHVVKVHCFRLPSEDHGQIFDGHNHELPTTFNNLEDDGECNMPVFEKSGLKKEQILSVEFMRKYIHIAKCLKPKLSERACEVIANEYSYLRGHEAVEADVVRTQPVTVRTLETLIRLATAHAKARLSNTVTAKDAEDAIELIQFAYFKKVLPREKRKRDDHNEIQSRNDTSSDKNAALKRRKIELAETQISDPASKSCSRPHQTSDYLISKERLDVFKQNLFNCFQKIRDQSIPRSDLTDMINDNVGEKFSEEEITSAISHMTKENQIMFADNVIFLI